MDQSAVECVSGDWRQGSALTRALVQTLVDDAQIPDSTLPRSKVPTGTFKRFLKYWARLVHHESLVRSLEVDAVWVVVSQDCDIVNPCFEKEPFVELIKCRPIAEKSSTLIWGDNPRILQFEDESGRAWEVNIADRVRVDRRYLCCGSPDPDRGLSRENTSHLKRWLSRRYVRAAFPDTFNERIREAIKKIRKKAAFTKNAGVVTGIYFLCDDDEKPDDVPYNLVAWATMKDAQYDDPSLRKAGEEVVTILEAELSKMPGIEIGGFELVKQSRITLENLFLFKRWDFDSLSLKAGDDEPPSD